MNKLIDEVLSGRQIVRLGDFVANKAGLELEAQGLSALSDVENKLVCDVSRLAQSISTSAGLATRFPGLDYVLRYYLRFGVNANPAAAAARIASFPKPLLIAVLRVSCHAFRAVKPVDSPIPIPPDFADLVVRLSRCDDEQIRQTALRAMKAWAKAGISGRPG